MQSTVLTLPDIHQCVDRDPGALTSTLALLVSGNGKRGKEIAEYYQFTSLYLALGIGRMTKPVLDSIDLDEKGR